MSYEDIIDKKRPKSKHPQMARSRRAKIFQPFAALTGYEEATAQKEKNYQAKIELTPEKEESLNHILMHLHKNERVTCVYFVYRHNDQGEYVMISGQVREINQVYHYLMIDQRKIAFDDLYDLKTNEI